MHDDHQTQNGYPGWRMPSPFEILISIERLASRVETAQEMTLDAIKSGFQKADKAHARITALDGRVSTLEAQARVSGSTTASPRHGLLASLTEFLKAMAEALPSVKELFLAAAVLAAALWGTVPEGLTVSLSALPHPAKPSEP